MTLTLLISHQHERGRRCKLLQGLDKVQVVDRVSLT